MIPYHLRLNFKWVLEIFVIAIFFAVVLFSAQEISQPLTQKQIKEFIVSFGLLSPIIFIILTALTNVIPPLAATPLWLAGALIFGFPAYIYMFLANILGYSANYFIARILGRPTVLRLVGKKAAQEIDHFVGFTNLRVFTLLRLVGGTVTDYLSYAAGLSSMQFFPYIVASLVGSLPLTLFGFVVVYAATSQGFTVAAGYLGAYYILCNLIALLVIPILAYNSKHRTRVK